MPTNQSKIWLAALDRVEAAITAGSDIDDLRELRAMLRTPSRISTAEQNFMTAILAGLEAQLDAVRTQRAGLLGAVKQLRRFPGPESEGADAGDG
jgi:hypothetical protein